MKIPMGFIIIDDDEINNFYCSIIINQTAPESVIQTFLNAEKGFDYLKNEFVNNENTSILFLDINMPTWSGWEFLRHFEKLQTSIKKQIKIYMLSSSLDPGDYRKSEDNKYVAGYIEKPLTEFTVLSILEEQGAFV